MVLSLGASFWTDANEAVIDAFVTEDDLVTPVVPDSMHFDLLLQTTDQVGATTLRALGAMDVTNDYISSDKQFHVRFRDPGRRQDLWLTAIATIGSSTLQKTVQVGITANEKTEMDFSDNLIFTEDVLALIPTGGGNDPIMPDNNVVLAPPLQIYDETFIFNAPQPADTYSDLQYSGGAVNRLLLNSQTNSYQLQESKAPWLIPAYLFMEPAATNLMTNSFFLVATGSTVPTINIPQTWTFDSAQALATYTLGFDHNTSSDAKIWQVRFRQNNIFPTFTTTSLICNQAIPVTGHTLYTFSTYLRTRLMTSDTVVKNVTLTISWYDNTTLISTSTETLLTSDYTGMSIASVTGNAPIAATNAKIKLDFYDVDAGDDIECTLFAPQFEQGNLPTSRILSTRLADQVETAPYNAQNQKIRFQFISGFGNSGLAAPLVLTTGPLAISFTSTGVTATLEGGPTLTFALVIAPGDFVDLTFQHVQNGKFSMYRAGQLVAQTTLGSIAATSTPVVIEGAGLELLQLNVFSRS